MTDDLIVGMRDVRAAMMCASGARRFFQKNNLDWKKFLEQGIPATELSVLNDAMANKVIEVARGRRQEANDRV